jgi:hypothetical protein
MSTATIYAHRSDASNDEATGVLGGDEPDVPEYWAFSIEIAKAWEAAQLEAPTPATRKLALRSAMVMSPQRGGVFEILLRMARCRLGGAIAGGRQYVSWIHEFDFVRAVEFLIEHEELEGAVNLVSPRPLPQREVHGRIAQGFRGMDSPSRQPLDGRARRPAAAFGFRAAAEEPARRTRAAARGRISLRTVGVGRRCSGPGRTVSRCTGGLKSSRPSRHFARIDEPMTPPARRQEPRFLRRRNLALPRRGMRRSRELEASTIRWMWSAWIE